MGREITKVQRRGRQEILSRSGWWLATRGSHRKRTGWPSGGLLGEHPQDHVLSSVVVGRGLSWGNGTAPRPVAALFGDRTRWSGRPLSAQAGRRFPESFGRCFRDCPVPALGSSQLLVVLQEHGGKGPGFCLFVFRAGTRPPPGLQWS